MRKRNLTKPRYLQPAIKRKPDWKAREHAKVALIRFWPPPGGHGTYPASHRSQRRRLQYLCAIYLALERLGGKRKRRTPARASARSCPTTGTGAKDVSNGILLACNLAYLGEQEEMSTPATPMAFSPMAAIFSIIRVHLRCAGEEEGSARGAQESHRGRLRKHQLDCQGLRSRLSSR